MTTNPTIETQTGTSSGSGTADQAKETAATAAEEAKLVAQAAGDQARTLLDEARTQVQDQSRTQRDRIVELLHSFTDELEQMSQERDGMAAQAARQVAGRTRSLEQRIDGREPSELLDDVRAFARRRPAVFLAGAAVAGMVAGRLLRGAKDAPSTTSASSPGTSAATGGTGAGATWAGSTEQVTPAPAYGEDPLTAPLDTVAPNDSGRDVGRPAGSP